MFKFAKILNIFKLLMFVNRLLVQLKSLFSPKIILYVPVYINKLIHQPHYYQYKYHLHQPLALH